MTLVEYRRKRDFSKTPEPRGKIEKPHEKRSFVIQKHAARKLHYDFRLEVDGVLTSWAIPKGPSLDPQVRRLAVQVEDHPLSYLHFEGTIPEGAYGSGEVIVWDTGTYEISGGEKTMRKGLAEGRLTFVLRGKKVHGTYSLVRFQGKRQWLLRKRNDKYARPGEDLTRYDRSVISSRRLPDGLALTD